MFFCILLQGFQCCKIFEGFGLLGIRVVGFRVLGCGVCRVGFRVQPGLGLGFRVYLKGQGT